MCGIIAALGKTTERRLREVVGGLAHRGPDGQGVTSYPGVALGHRRLAIMDPAAGKQPLFNEDGSLAVVFNGEIYNHADLRRDLAVRHSFATRCDTEVLPHLFEERGMRGFQELDGMYAFALAGETTFVAARDPVGIKPLYYMRENGSLWFGSEIKVLSDAGPGEIHEFPAGGWYDAREDRWEEYSWLTSPALRYVTPESAIPLIRKALDQAVERRLMSDVPLGAFLSGGLDSSLIAAVAKRKLGSLHTFSVGLQGSQDLKRSFEVAEAIGSTHHGEALDEREILRRVPEIVASLECYDRDLVRSAIPCYFVSRLARREVKVILTGEGADELFAGYRYLREYREPAALQAEMIRLVRGLHNMNLQRVDRMTMAHGLEARVPFLDLKFIELALSIDPALKIYTHDRPEKWLLRSAFTGVLPDPILWRMKEQFDEGSGVADLMPRLAAGRVDLDEEQSLAGEAGLPPLRDAEEAWYFRIFRERYDPARVRRTLGRWVPAGPAPVH